MPPAVTLETLFQLEFLDAQTGSGNYRPATCKNRWPCVSAFRKCYLFHHQDQRICV